MAKKKSSSKKNDAYIEINANPWMIISFVLLALIVVFFSLGFVNTHASAKSVGKNFVNYMNSQGNVTVSYLSATSFSPSLYQINVSLQNQTIPVYITKDGKYFVQLVMPLK